jgi:hypothetical protein
MDDWGKLAFEFSTTDEHRWTRIREIPKGFYQSARRCEERATPGNGQNKIKTPAGFYQMKTAKGFNSFRVDEWFWT